MNIWVVKGIKKEVMVGLGDLFGRDDWTYGFWRKRVMM
jgi:hypothetical protein